VNTVLNLRVPSKAGDFFVKFKIGRTPNASELMTRRHTDRHTDSTMTEYPIGSAASAAVPFLVLFCDCMSTFPPIQIL